MIDPIFGKEENTIDVCSGSVRGRTVALPASFTRKNKSTLSSIAQSTSPSSYCLTVDINPHTNPDIIADGHTLDEIPNGTFKRWRCDHPYNNRTAEAMYGTDLPIPGKGL